MSCQDSKRCRSPSLFRNLSTNSKEHSLVRHSSGRSSPIRRYLLWTPPRTTLFLWGNALVCCRQTTSDCQSDCNRAVRFLQWELTNQSRKNDRTGICLLQRSPELGLLFGYHPFLPYLDLSLCLSPFFDLSFCYLFSSRFFVGLLLFNELKNQK